MAGGRRIRDEQEARRFLAAVRRSGVSRGDWARARGIDGRSLRAWDMNLARRGTRPGPRKSWETHPRELVELVPIGAKALDTELTFSTSPSNTESGCRTRKG